MSAAEMREALIKAREWVSTAAHFGDEEAAAVLRRIDAAVCPLPGDEGMVEMLRKALEDMTKRYCELVNCGDCGFWDPEKEGEVKAARAALRAINGGKP